MSLKFILLGCGSSFGVPRADGNWGKCNPKLLKNYRTRCSALISSNNLKILIDTSPDLRSQLIKQKIFNIDYKIDEQRADNIYIGGIYFYRNVFGQS